MAGNKGIVLSSLLHQGSAQIRGVIDRYDADRDKTDPFEHTIVPIKRLIKMFEAYLCLYQYMGE